MLSHIHIYVWVSVYVYTHTDTHTHRHTDRPTHTHTPMGAHTQTHTHRQTDTCIHTPQHIHSCIHIHTGLSFIIHSTKLMHVFPKNIPHLMTYTLCCDITLNFVFDFDDCSSWAILGTWGSYVSVPEFVDLWIAIFPDPDPHPHPGPNLRFRCDKRGVCTWGRGVVRPGRSAHACRCANPGGQPIHPNPHPDSICK